MLEHLLISIFFFLFFSKPAAPALPQGSTITSFQFPNNSMPPRSLDHHTPPTAPSPANPTYPPSPRPSYIPHPIYPSLPSHRSTPMTSQYPLSMPANPHPLPPTSSAQPHLSTYYNPPPSHFYTPMDTKYIHTPSPALTYPQRSHTYPSPYAHHNPHYTSHP